MNQPSPIKHETQYKTVVLEDPKQLVVVQGLPCIDGGMAKINGKAQKMLVRYDNKPELAAQIAAWQAAWAEYQAWQAAEFDRNVPGLAELESAQDASYNEQVRYDAAFERMMDTGSSISPRPVDKSLEAKAQELARKFPRAAAYLTAKGYTMASNVAKYSAGKQAMALIAEGGDLDQAMTILKNWLPQSAQWN